jgi:hypothetical protein
MSIARVSLVRRQRRGDVGEEGDEVGDLLDRRPLAHAVLPRERVALDAAGGDFSAELVEGEGTFLLSFEGD